MVESLCEKIKIAEKKNWKLFSNVKKIKKIRHDKVIKWNLSWVDKELNVGKEFTLVDSDALSFE